MAFNNTRSKVAIYILLEPPSPNFDLVSSMASYCRVIGHFEASVANHPQNALKHYQEKKTPLNTTSSKQTHPHMGYPSGILVPPASNFTPFRCTLFSRCTDHFVTSDPNDPKMTNIMRSRVPHVRPINTPLPLPLNPKFNPFRSTGSCV